MLSKLFKCTQFSDLLPQHKLYLTLLENFLTLPMVQPPFPMVIQALHRVYNYNNAVIVWLVQSRQVLEENKKLGDVGNFQLLSFIYACFSKKKVSFMLRLLKIVNCIFFEKSR